MRNLTGVTTTVIIAIALVALLTTQTSATAKVAPSVPGNETGNMTDPPTTNATTNERDYKTGHNWASVEYYCAVVRNDDCGSGSVIQDNGFDECHSAQWNKLFPHFITNSTACWDGYKDGWKHWCFSDTKDCAEYISLGVFPGAKFTGFVQGRVPWMNINGTLYLANNTRTPVPQGFDNPSYLRHA